MTDRHTKLAELSRKFEAKSEQLYSGQLTAEAKWQILLERVRIAKEMYQVVSQAPASKVEVKIAGSSNKDFVNKMREKGFIFRYVGE